MTHRFGFSADLRNAFIPISRIIVEGNSNIMSESDGGHEAQLVINNNFMLLSLAWLVWY